MNDFMRYHHGMTTYYSNGFHFNMVWIDEDPDTYNDEGMCIWSRSDDSLYYVDFGTHRAF
jgi:hypothetical protein